MKKNNKRERPLQTQLSKWTRPVLAEEQTRTTPHTNDDECVRVTMFAFIFLLSIYTKTGGMLNCLFQCVCLCMCLVPVQYGWCWWFVVLCIMYACVFAGVMRLLLVITIVC